MKIRFPSNSLGAFAAAVAVVPTLAEAAEIDRATIGPDYKTDPAWQPCSGCARGERFDLFMPIAGTTFNCEKADFPLLKDKCIPNCGQLYPRDRLGTRNVTVYIPPSYEDGDEAAVHVDLEGTDNIQTDANVTMPDGAVLDTNRMWTNLMDNLIGADDPVRSLPTFVYVAMGLAGPGGNTAFDGEEDNCADGHNTPRAIELCPVFEDYATFVALEVLPWVANHPDIRAKYPGFRFADDPAARVVQGQSNGGGMATKMVLLRPDLFGTAIGFSSQLITGPFELVSDGEYPLGNADLWVPEPEGKALIANMPYGGGRYYLNINENDIGTPGGCFHLPGGPVFPADAPAYPNGTLTPYSNFLEGNNKTAMALAEKGYEVRYVYARDACHTDIKVVATEYPSAIVWAWSAWREKIEARDSSGTKLTKSSKSSKRGKRVKRSKSSLAVPS